MFKNVIYVKENIKACSIVLLLVVGLLSINVKAQITIQRGPHVQNTTTNSVQIAWVTNNFMGTPSSKVKWGPIMFDGSCPPALPNEVIGTSIRDTTDGVIRHSGTLSLPTPDAQYCYQVITIRDGVEEPPFPNPPSPNFQFRTFPLLQPDFTFVLFGDSGVGPDVEGTACPVQGQPQRTRQFAVRNKVRDIWNNGIGAPLRFLLHTGDVIYNCGDDGDYPAKYFSPYGNIDIMQIPNNLIRILPMFPSLGNHDYGGDRGKNCPPPPIPRARAYLQNFYLPMADLQFCANRPLTTKRYYSFRYGNAHFIALDTDLLLNPTFDLDADVGRCQLPWLENELQKSNATWKFVYFHIPPFSSGDTHGSGIDPESLNIRNQVSAIIQKYNVDIAFSGHEHTYELTRRILVTGTNLNDYILDQGVYYVVTGGGGNILGDLRIQGPNPWTSCFRGCAQNFFHATKVVINNANSNLNLQPVDINNQCPDGQGCPLDQACTLQIKKGTLQGTVTTNTGIPISGATVTVFVPDVPDNQQLTDCQPDRLPLPPRMQRAQVTTDTLGNYNLSLFAGNSAGESTRYSLLVTHPNHQAEARCGLVVSPNLITTALFRLIPR